MLVTFKSPMLNKVNKRENVVNRLIWQDLSSFISSEKMEKMFDTSARDFGD